MHDSPLGEWSRSYRLGVEFRQGDGAPGRATLTVPRERFESLREGDRMPIRYLPAFPMFARSNDHSTVKVLKRRSGVVVRSVLLGFRNLARSGRSRAVAAGPPRTRAAVFAAGTASIAAGLMLLFPAAAPVRLAAAGDDGAGARRQADREIAGRTIQPHVQGRGSRSGLSRACPALPHRPVPLRRVRVAGLGARGGRGGLGECGRARGGRPLPVQYDPRTPRDAHLGWARGPSANETDTTSGGWSSGAWVPRDGRCGTQDPGSRWQPRRRRPVHPAGQASSAPE